jgi:hypothetical protein
MNKFKMSSELMSFNFQIIARICTIFSVYFALFHFLYVKLIENAGGGG